MICKYKNSFLLIAMVVVALFSNAQKLNSEHIISLAELENSSNDNLVLLHVSTAEDYASGHIPMAINVTREFMSDSTQEYGGVMATKEQMSSLLGRLGVNPTDKIILYDARGGCDATRLWWILDYYGHNNAAILDGGLQAWKDEHLTMSKEAPLVKQSEYFFPDEPNNGLIANLDDVQKLIKDSNAVLLDVRTFDEFTGKTQKKGAFRKGRIPTSILMDWVRLIDYRGDLKLKSIPEIKKLLAARGISKGKPIIVYCHSGVRSSHTTFVLTEVLGYKNVRNYDGSWIEWSFDDELPIETGEIPKPKKDKPTPDYWWLLIIPIAVGLFFLNRRNLRK